jgi:hypothetical protein
MKINILTVWTRKKITTRSLKTEINICIRACMLMRSNDNLITFQGDIFIVKENYVSVQSGPSILVREDGF